MAKRHLTLLDQCITAARVERGNQALNFRARAVGAVCSKGCNNCCFNPITISVLEGLSIYRWLKAQRVWPAFKQAVLDHHGTVHDLPLPVWLLSQIQCPFLAEDKTCSIYETRPLTCRVTASKGDPSECHPHQLQVAEGIVPRQEVLENRTKFEKAQVKRLGLSFHVFPLSTALLLAEQLDGKKLDRATYTFALTQVV